VKAERINAQTTQQKLEKLERNNPTKKVIHVFLDSAKHGFVAHIDRGMAARIWV
jgi:hypothetical protein